MSAPLTYDDLGRPLRAGDQVKLVGHGAITTVRGPAPAYTNCEVALNIPTGNDYPWLVGNGTWLRKIIDGDHPAGESFRALMGRLKTTEADRSTEALNEERVPQGMPWTCGGVA